MRWSVLIFFAACGAATPAPQPAPPPVEDPAADTSDAPTFVITTMTRYRSRMCACTALPCFDKVDADLAPRFAEMGKRMKASPLPSAALGQMASLGAAAIQCKVAALGGR